MSLWYRVIVARYGDVGGCNEEACVGVGRWFADIISREVGDETHTLFWWDPWIDDLVLKSSFSRLFDLTVTKMATVVEMFSPGWGEDGEAWQWRRKLFSWEEELVRECSEFLFNIVLQSNLSDMHVAMAFACLKNYSVTSAYNYMMLAIINQAIDLTAYAWNKEVPLKASLFVWRLLRNRLSTTDNLIRRHVLQHNAQLCVGGYGKLENVDHLFLSCDYFGKIWNCSLQWLDFSMVQPEHAINHLQQFESLCDFHKDFHKSIYLVFNLI